MPAAERLDASGALGTEGDVGAGASAGSRTSLARLRRKVMGRNGLMFADTGVNALVGLCLVAGAARHLGPRDLAAFSLAQLVVTLTMSTLRSAVYGPAMAAQRATGRAVVPTDWAFSVSVPTGVVLGAFLVMLVPGLGEDKWLAFGLMAAVSVVVLVQDGLRSAIISRERPQWALAADTLAFALLVVPMALHAMPRSAIGYLCAWGVTVLIGVLVTLVGLLRTRHGGYTRQSLAAAWRLGRWAALDSIFAVSAYLLPMFATTLAAGSTSAGTYRVLQTALGPLNIIQTTLVAVFGLDSWKTATLPGLRTLQRKVRLLFWSLLGLSTLVSVVGLPLMVMVTGLKDDHLLRIGLLVAAYGIMSALTMPFLAASFALGYQKFGAVIRFLVLVASLLVSLPIQGGRWVPWHDPIGTALFASSGLMLLGWALSYSMATRKEERLLAPLHVGEDESSAAVTSRSVPPRPRGRHRRQRKDLRAPSSRGQGTRRS